MGRIGSGIAVGIGFALLVGCSSVSYLNPNGAGKARTMPGQCPFPLRVLEVVVPGSTARIYVNAFEADRLASEAVVFLVVSEQPVRLNWVTRPNGDPQKHAHTVSFPEGVAIRVIATDGRSARGDLATQSDGEGGTAAVVLRFSLPAGLWENFTVTFPAVIVDRQRVEIGTVTFEPGHAPIYGINC